MHSIPYSSTYSSSKAALEAYVLSKINEYDEKNQTYHYTTRKYQHRF